MPELLATPHSLAHMQQLIEAGADAFVVGEEAFALRLPTAFSLEEISRAQDLCRALHKKLYISMNAIFHNERVDALAPYLRALADIGVDAVLFGDPALLIARREAGVDLPLHWSPETLATNAFTADYWGRRGAVRAVLARELSLEEILEMKERADVAIEVQVHGMTCMFQSKRRLLGNYFAYQGKSLEIVQSMSGRRIALYDQDRSSYYPVYEDTNGTHIFGPADICLLDELAELIEAGIDSFKIDSILQEPEYATAVVRLYRRALDAYAQSPGAYESIQGELFDAARALQAPLRPLDSGFLYKETVY